MKAPEIITIVGLYTASALVVGSMIGMDSVTFDPPWQTLPPPHHEEIAHILNETRWMCDGEGCLDEEDVKLLAFTLSREGMMNGFQPELIAGIIMVENPWLDSLAVSSAGAVGLMQVMPFHYGSYEECGELRSVEGNVCYGVRILREKMLLAYNGCTYVACSSYSDKVVMRSEGF